MAKSLTSSIPDDSLSNTEVHHLLGLRVARELLGANDDVDRVEIGPLSTNFFSFTFSVKASTSGGARSVFVKIPKMDLRGRVPSILPITAGDRLMAEEEESSLRLLMQQWHGDDLEVRWVNLSGIISEYNAIVTERIFADEALSVFRRLDLRRRFGFSQDAQRLRRLMARLGAALGRFHQTNAMPAVFRLSDAVPKLEFYCRELAASSGSAWPERILGKLKSMNDIELPGIEVPTLKGIDIRNVLIDARDSLYFLDPGRTKLTFREADLARFVMTYRILYWGRLLLLLARVPDPKAEVVFLEAYYSNSQAASSQLLSLFLLKEQLKHWHTALDSLQRLPWPPVVERLVAKIYVNPFYERQVASQFLSITR